MKRYFLLVKVLNNLKKKQKCLVPKNEIKTKVGRAFPSDFWIGYVGVKKKRNTDENLFQSSTIGMRNEHCQPKTATPEHKTVQCAALKQFKVG